MIDDIGFPLDFTAEMCNVVSAGNPGHNLVLSPYSMATALGMALAGARGRTADELCAVLGTDSPDRLAAAIRDSTGRLQSGDGDRSDSLIVDIAAAAWFQRDAAIKAGYRQTLTDMFRAAPRLADFGTDPAGAAREINSFVADRTRGKITELVDPGAFDALTRLVLVNAAYFRAAWRQPFTGPTRPAPFRLADGSSVQVDMMHQRFDRIGYYGDHDVQALSLPFAGDTFAMALILPEAPDHDHDLTGDRLIQLLQGFQPESVQVELPRWRFRTSQELRPRLQQLGIQAAFDASAADFSGISDEPLEISQVRHEAYIAVDESGAEAAAATAVMVVARAVIARQPRRVTFDRPYQFVIFETTTAMPLFIGSVADPRSAS